MTLSRYARWTLLAVGSLVLAVGMGALTLVAVGSHKVPALLVPLGTQFQVTPQEKEDAERFFKRFPFVFKSSFRSFIRREKDGALRSMCYAHLPSVVRQEDVRRLILERLRAETSEQRADGIVSLQVFLRSQPLDEGIEKAMNSLWARETDWGNQLGLAQVMTPFHRAGFQKSFEETLSQDSTLRKKGLAVLGLWCYADTPENRVGALEVFKMNQPKERHFLLLAAWFLLCDGAKPLFEVALTDGDPSVRDFAKKRLVDIKAGKVSAGFEVFHLGRDPWRGSRVPLPAAPDVFDNP